MKKVNKKTDIELYQELIDGKRKKLQRFWNKERAKTIMRYIILDKLKWSRDDIVKNISKTDFYKKHKLIGALKQFNNYVVCSNRSFC